MIRNIVTPLVSTLALTLAVASLSACKSEIDDKPKAKVEAAEKVDDKGDKAEEAGAEGDEAAAGKTFALDAEASKIGFIGAKITGDHKGSFETIKGSATVEGDKLSALEVTADINSMTTDADGMGLGDHLKGAEFFDAENHPEAKFTLLSAEPKPGEGGATHELAGNLEFHGKANKVTFPATVNISETGVSGKAEFSINRKLWGMEYPGKPDDAIKDEVALTLDLQFK